MFGYIRPQKCELKFKEYEYYRAVYCGLCHALRKRYGLLSSFALNYDFVFAALLMMPSYKCEAESHRCICSLRKKTCIRSEAIARCADISVVLIYLKLCDDTKDERKLIKRIFAHIGRLVMKRPYARAVSCVPEYAEHSKTLYDELCRLEKENIPSIDAPADKFAKILSEIPDGKLENAEVIREILYHTGRFIYIIDALDDLADDLENKEYNPILSRYGIKRLPLGKDITDSVLSTLELSRNTAVSDFNLIADEKTVNDAVIKNILQFGMRMSVKKIIDKGV